MNPVDVKKAFLNAIFKVQDNLRREAQKAETPEEALNLLNQATVAHEVGRQINEALPGEWQVEEPSPWIEKVEA